MHLHYLKNLHQVLLQLNYNPTNYNSEREVPQTRSQKRDEEESDFDIPSFLRDRDDF